ncbi:MAG: glutamine amidotransferase, partial [Planctomycetota bacterium]|nr:glutamine amidotransferase [Planctomycetota bacterium]
MSGEPFKPQIVAPTHPILNGLDVAAAPALRPGAAYGKVKEGATVLARSPDGKDIWVAWQKGRGRCLWTGGVFANDEISEDFAKWEGFGKFYGQALAWLGEARAGARKPIAKATAEATLTVDLKKKLPTVTAKHFGIHGQEDAPGGSYPMKDADLALYEALNLAGTFARTSAFAGIKRKPGGNEQDLLDDGTDLTTFDREKYDFKNADIVLADLERIKAEPIFLYWCPWWGPNWPDPARYTKYFAASIEHVNGPPGAASRPRLKYFEIMNEPHLGPANEVLPRYAEFFNHAVEKLRNRYGKEIKFGCGGFYEWTYVQAIIDRCGKNLDWLSRHPYGHTGEAVFYLQDKYQEYAQSKGIPDLKFIITEWDFWIYGEPAFDYIMMRWKPLLDRADSCLGTLHYRWREYHEGGYVFGLHGEFDQRYGYNAFWIMRHCRGQQYEVKVESPQLGAAVIPGREEYKARLSDPLASASHLYAVAAADGDKYNSVVYYGYPRENPLTGQC